MLLIMLEIKQEVNQPSALTILLENINNQRDYITYLEGRLNIIERLLNNGWIDWRTIRNTPNFVYDINKNNNDLVIKYYDWREVLIPLNTNNAGR